MKLRWLTLLVGSLLVVPLASQARDEVIPLESPRYFVQAFGGYAHRDVKRQTKFDPGTGTSEVEPARVTRSWLAGATVTVPIWKSFGVRGTVLAGSDELSLGGAPATSFDDISFGAVGFWRDPTEGQFGAGYLFSDTDVSPDTSIRSISTHSVPVYAALYMPDFGGGTTVDWRVDFQYDRMGMDTPNGRVDVEAYSGLATSTWYVNGSVSFDGRFLYERETGSPDSDVLEGILALEFLLPTGKRKYATLEVFGGYGRERMLDVAPFGDFRQRVWQVGFQAAVFFPGVSTLVELNRAYR